MFSDQRGGVGRERRCIYGALFILETSMVFVNLVKSSSSGLGFWWSLSVGLSRSICESRASAQSRSDL